MDWTTLVSSSLQIIIWSLQACSYSVGVLFAAMALGLSGASLVFFLIMPAWIRLWNRAWNPINVIFLKFILAVVTFTYGLVFVGSSHMDFYLESLIETARTEASAPFVEWRQVGFPQGLNRLEENTDVCSVLKKQIPAIQAEIIEHEPFRSWPAGLTEPIPVSCENAALVQSGKQVKRDDNRFNANFNNAFEITKQRFKQSIKGLTGKVIHYLSWILGGCFTLCLIYFSTMAYFDIDE
ncbi:MAG: hypothetical protein ACXWTS_00195 [Methylococcaceae bacterium]